MNVLSEMFDLGLFDNKNYVGYQPVMDEATKREAEEAAYQAHLKSVILLKNNNVLPVRGQKLFVKAFGRGEEETEKYQELLLKNVKALNIEIIEDYKEADIAALFLYPLSGSYFDATPGLLELEICEDKTNIALNGDTYKKTTLSNFYELNKIVGYMNENGKKL